MQVANKTDAKGPRDSVNSDSSGHTDQRANRVHMKDAKDTRVTASASDSPGYAHLRKVADVAAGFCSCAPSVPRPACTKTSHKSWVLDQ